MVGGSLLRFSRAENSGCFQNSGRASSSRLISIFYLGQALGRWEASHSHPLDRCLHRKHVTMMLESETRLRDVTTRNSSLRASATRIVHASRKRSTLPRMTISSRHHLHHHLRGCGLSCLQFMIPNALQFVTIQSEAQRQATRYNPLYEMQGSGSDPILHAVDIIAEVV